MNEWDTANLFNFVEHHSIRTRIKELFITIKTYLFILYLIFSDLII